MIVIGITGTNGSGKGAIVQYLKKKGYKHFSAREFIVNKIKEKGMDVNRNSMRIIADDMRKKFGPSYIIDSLYFESIKSKNNSIIESIRCPGEILSLKKNKNFYLFSVDAPRNIRFERISKRNSSTDNVSFEEFVSQEEMEWNNIEPIKMNVRKCIELSDYKFINDKDFLSLHMAIDVALKDIKTKG